MNPQDETPIAPVAATEGVQREETTEQLTGDRSATVPAAGARLSFRDIRRQLTEEELRQSGVQKLLIEDFERAESECDRLRSFVDKFYAADRRVGELEVKAKKSTAMEIMSGVGFTGGGAIMSLAPYFWELNTTKGIAAIGVGFLMIVGVAVDLAVTAEAKQEQIVRMVHPREAA